MLKDSFPVVCTTVLLVSILWYYAYLVEGYCCMRMRLLLGEQADDSWKDLDRGGQGKHIGVWLSRNSQSLLVVHMSQENRFLRNVFEYSSRVADMSAKWKFATREISDKHTVGTSLTLLLRRDLQYYRPKRLDWRMRQINNL